MYKFSCSLLAVVLLSATACRSNNAGVLKASSSDVSPLKAADFPAPLTKEMIRSTAADLDDATFATKWAAASATPLMLLRSFPPAYHQDLKQVPDERMPGGETLCFGDAHIENFGFLHLKGQTIFAFNDLDDSGYCRVAVDAARYFTSVRRYNSSPALVAKLLNQYVATIAKASAATTPPSSVMPKWSKVAAKALEKNTSGGKFVGLTAPSNAQLAAINAAIQADPVLSSLTILDIASAGKDAGGSGGYERYRLLTEGANGMRAIIELKEATTPGTSFGAATKVLGLAERLQTLTSTFWKTETPGEYYYLMIGSKHFMVRNRLNLESISLNKLTDQEVEDVLMAEVSYMAQVHAPAWKQTAGVTILNWLAGTSDTLAQRWGAFGQNNEEAQPTSSDSNDDQTASSAGPMTE